MDAGEEVVQLPFINHCPALWTGEDSEALLREQTVAKFWDLVDQAVLQMLRNDLSVRADAVARYPAARGGSPKSLGGQSHADAHDPSVRIPPAVLSRRRPEIIQPLHWLISSPAVPTQLGLLGNWRRLRKRWPSLQQKSTHPPHAAGSHRRASIVNTQTFIVNCLKGSTWCVGKIEFA
ncbi:hypothetical protein B0H17DRAFT_1145321 [Mycena rosella]|uniref:Uncharacterized protein n=1 Tax=Mycena rosella TaxID=1033263 RepID=A0AAD7G627_MYCRO|nr:hypothetical protein B0H17DRAFT_1145321 [Mycena rosella]